MHATERSLQEERDVNKKFLATNITSYRATRDIVENNIKVLTDQKQHKGAGPANAGTSLFWKTGWEPLSEAQWHTAYQTTGLALMDSHEVARYAESYAEADQINKAWDTAGHHLFDLGGYEFVDPDPRHLSSAQIDDLLKGCGIVLTQLQVVGFELQNWALSVDVPSELSREEILALHHVSPGAGTATSGAHKPLKQP